MGIDITELKSSVALSADSAFQSLTYQREKGLISKDEYKAKLKLLKG